MHIDAVRNADRNESTCLSQRIAEINIRAWEPHPMSQFVFGYYDGPRAPIKLTLVVKRRSPP